MRVHHNCLSVPSGWQRFDSPKALVSALCGITDSLCALARCMLYIHMREQRQGLPQCTRWIVRAKLTLRERACLHAMPARSPDTQAAEVPYVGDRLA
jgi:hypothetical protein